MPRAQPKSPDPPPSHDPALSRWDNEGGALSEGRGSDTFAERRIRDRHIAALGGLRGRSPELGPSPKLR